MSSPNKLNKETRTNESKKKQTNLNQFLFSKDRNAAVMTKKITHKNVREELDNLSKQENKRMKLAMDSFSKEYRQANRKLIQKSMETAFAKGVASSIEEVNTISSKNDKYVQAQASVQSNKLIATQSSLESSSQTLPTNTQESNSQDKADIVNVA